MSSDFENLKNCIREDLSRVSDKFSFPIFIRKLLVNHSFKLTFWFRVGSYLKAKKNVGWKIIYAFVYMILRHYQFKTGIQLASGTKIGKGLLFPHYSCIVINCSAEIGDYCTMLQGVTIGSVRGKGSPVIGNNVVIAAGAKVIGNVKIGHNVFIGANAVVVKDIPNNAVVGGIPAQIINYNGEKNVKYYL